jgi:hypothetical protein
MIASDPEYLEYGAVRLSADSAAEMDHGRALVRIPRAAIVRIELVRGPGAERPLVGVVLAIVLAVIAVAGPVILMLALLRHVSIPAKLVTSLAFIIPAIWLLDLALRPRWYLRVDNGSRLTQAAICKEQ